MNVMQKLGQDGRFTGDYITRGSVWSELEAKGLRMGRDFTVSADPTLSTGKQHIVELTDSGRAKLGMKVSHKWPMLVVDGELVKQPKPMEVAAWCAEYLARMLRAVGAADIGAEKATDGGDGFVVDIAFNGSGDPLCDLSWHAGRWCGAFHRYAGTDYDTGMADFASIDVIKDDATLSPMDAVKKMAEVYAVICIDNVVMHHEEDRMRRIEALGNLYYPEWVK